MPSRTYMNLIYSSASTPSVLCSQHSITPHTTFKLFQIDQTRLTRRSCPDLRWSPRLLLHGLEQKLARFRKLKLSAPVTLYFKIHWRIDRFPASLAICFIIMNVSLPLLLFVVSARCFSQTPLPLRVLDAVESYSAGGPFTARFNKRVQTILNHFHVPSVSMSVVNGNETFAEGYGYAAFPDEKATSHDTNALSFRTHWH